MNPVVVFVGPTLPAAEAALVLPATYLPPVSQGDVYRVARDLRPLAIGIIDGYFERVPAVWHKEILWALHQGIHVFGAASMGALRAAELHPFGMVGVGAVFEAFRDGHLEDDDEVTVAHAPERLGYGDSSEAMVNIRATLAKARDQGVIGGRTGAALVRLAKELYYPWRDYDHIVRLGGAEGLDPDELAHFLTWVTEHRVERKREDALAMLHAMRALCEHPPGLRPVDFHFEHTDAWEQVARRTGRQIVAAHPDPLPTDALLDELRLQEGAYAAAIERALARVLALETSAAPSRGADGEALRETFNRFCVERGIIEPEQIRAWMQAQDLDERGLGVLLEQEQALHAVLQVHGDDARSRLRDHLRSVGRYGPLSARAGRKRTYLHTRGLDNPGLCTSGIPEDRLLHWFFVRQRGGQVPLHLDLYARTQGFADRLSMLQAILREYYFATAEEQAEPC